uniref:Helicase ATP-binding domain-containing protein n=1 Tax=viral metagenome TaxID=1070528 RepID=A0A6C0E2J8_9ZZZZ
MGFIYVRTDNSKHQDNVCKLGQTDNIANRDSTYKTGEYIKGEFLLVIQIIDNIYTHIIVEILLQKYFSQLHKYHNGGNEFYKYEIIKEIVPFLETQNIKHKVLSKEEINKLLAESNNKQKVNSPEMILREFYQDNYLKEIIENLKEHKKVFIKAPTGFGKTHLYYKTIKELKLKKILFLTPRKKLNEQIIENKYSSYISDDNYKIGHYSDDTINKTNFIKKYSKLDKFIITSCYQSNEKLFKLIREYKLSFDAIFFDEAHFITSWSEDEDNINKFLDSKITKYRIFGSATPTEEIEENEDIYGSIVEKVKIHELINNEILCDIETIIKKLDNKKKEYHNLKDLIISTMTKHKKKKGIVYVNNCSNAKKLQKLMETQKDIKSYIYVSKDYDDFDECDKDITNFENNENPCIIIAVGKISYGYDNDFIDFICLGDDRQSCIDIRQIIGRGIRWNKSTYPNKLLHLLIPLYKDEFDKYPKNETLKKYLDYIIGECDKDIIIKNSDMCFISGKKDVNKDGKNYEGDNIPTEILADYSTTGYTKYTKFQSFLIKNKIYDEITYNEIYENNNWMTPLNKLKQKYPKFGFINIHPNRNIFYTNKKDAIKNYDIVKRKLMKSMDADDFDDLTQSELLIKINKIDKKIPTIDFDFYYV